MKCKACKERNHIMCPNVVEVHDQLEEAKSKLEAQARHHEAQYKLLHDSMMILGKERDEARAKLSEANGQLEATTHNLWDAVGKKDALTAHVARLVQVLENVGSSLLSINRFTKGGHPLKRDMHHLEGWIKNVLKDPLSTRCAEGQRLKDAELEAASPLVDYCLEVFASHQKGTPCECILCETAKAVTVARSATEKFEKGE